MYKSVLNNVGHIHCNVAQQHLSKIVIRKYTLFSLIYQNFLFASVIFLILGYQRADIDITFHITTAGNLTKVSGRDGSGVIYGCRELIDRLNDSEGKLNFPEELKDGPEMVLRGAYVGLQKMTYLPGYGVYEYPYTPERLLPIRV